MRVVCIMRAQRFLIHCQHLLPNYKEQKAHFIGSEKVFNDESFYSSNKYLNYQYEIKIERLSVVL